MIDFCRSLIKCHLIPAIKNNPLSGKISGGEVQSGDMSLPDAPRRNFVINDFNFT